MDKVLIILKIISLLHPNKVWDNASHLIYLSQDRKLMKKYLKGLKKDVGIKTNLKNYKIITNQMLTRDRKSVIYLYLGPKWIWKYDLKHLWKSHEDIGIWKTEVIAEEVVSDIGKPFLNLLKNYKQVTNSEWEKMQTFRGAKHGLTRPTKKK